MSGVNQPTRAAYLQAGGKSTRMGENKAFIDFHGQTLVARALETLNQICGEVTIVGDPEIFGRFGPTVADILPGCGPLGGIHAALTHSRAELNLMLAVDMPFASGDLLEFLLSKAAESAAVVTVARIGRGLQPLCAVYRPAFAPIAEQALRAGTYKIDAAFAGVSMHVIGEPELAGAGFSEKDFFNVNTPDDRRTAADLIP
jgi:molybdenum cofactor guanylyltransferase